MKQKNIRDFERESGRSSLIVGLILIAFGVLLGVVVGKDTSVISGIICFLIFTAVGVFVLCFKKIERAAREKAADPTSST